MTSCSPSFPGYAFPAEQQRAVMFSSVTFFFQGVCVRADRAFWEKGTPPASSSLREKGAASLLLFFPLQLHASCCCLETTQRVRVPSKREMDGLLCWFLSVLSSFASAFAVPASEGADALFCFSPIHAFSHFQFAHRENRVHFVDSVSIRNSISTQLLRERAG